MSAAPVSGGARHSPARLRQSMAALEAALDARIVTVADRAPVEEVAPTAELCVERYPAGAEGGGGGALRATLERAHARVSLAVANAE
jgi:hypothetical protein